MYENLINIRDSAKLHTRGNLQGLRNIFLGENYFGKSKPYGLFNTIIYVGYCPDLSGKADLTKGNKIIGNNPVGDTADKCHCN